MENDRSSNSTSVRLIAEAAAKLSLLAIATIFSSSTACASTCFGTVAKGRLAEGVQLPPSGRNYTAYSSLGVALGRTYVYDAVGSVILDAYRQLEKSRPGVMYVYGETGFASGGAFRPHRTHQAGLSVDFMVPVLDRAGRPAELPRNTANRYGYGLEFDSRGRLGNLTIDFEAIAEHLLQLRKAAATHGISIQRVIFDQSLMSSLLATRAGPALRSTIPFMQGKPWIRHDEHYHVDFNVSCLPLSTFAVAGAR